MRLQSQDCASVIEDLKIESFCLQAPIRSSFNCWTINFSSPLVRIKLLSIKLHIRLQIGSKLVRMPKTDFGKILAGYKPLKGEGQTGAIRSISKASVLKGI